MAVKKSGSKAKNRNTKTTAKVKVKAMRKPILSVMKSALKKKPASAVVTVKGKHRDGEPVPGEAVVRGVKSLTAYDKRTGLAQKYFLPRHPLGTGGSISDISCRWVCEPTKVPCLLPATFLWAGGWVNG